MTRTCDPLVNSQLLYRLSYRGIGLCKIECWILMERPPLVKSGLLFLKCLAYLQLVQTVSLLMGTPVFLLIHLS